MTEIVISDDKLRLDFGKIHHFLSTQSNWAKGITLDTVRRFTLTTTDAHGLFAKYGFTALCKPGSFMEIHRPNVYTD